MSDRQTQRSSSTQKHVTKSWRFPTATSCSGLRRYVLERSLRAATLTEQYTDDDFKGSPQTNGHSVAHSLDRPREPDSVDSSLAHCPLRKCLHGTSLSNLDTAGVDTLDHKDLHVHRSDKQFQISFHQTIETKQREKSSSQIIRLRLREPVLRVIKVQPEVIVFSKQALQTHKLLPARLLKTVPAVQINGMEGDSPLSISECRDKNSDLALELDIATSEVVAKKVTNNVTLENNTEWSLIPDRQIDLIDSLESPLSVLSPLSPFTDTDDLISSYQCTKPLCRHPSVMSDASTEDRHLSLAATRITCAKLVVNGKPHAHPLRSHPVTEADYIILSEELACLFPPRTDSLPSASSTASSKGSVSDTISPRTTRPPFPPRKDSLQPLNSFLNAQTERPRTSHHPNRPSRADSFIITNRSELSLSTSAQETKLLHRRSASVADLFHSLTKKSANRSQSVAPQVSAPILIQAPIKTPVTAPVPRKIQTPVHTVTPYTNQQPFRSHTWNMSQLSTHSSANASNPSTDVALSRNASQTSLHSNNANRRAFVMQRPNTSVFSLHSQNSTQDLNGMLSGYDTHLNSNTNLSSPRTPGTGVPPVPPKHEEIERLNRRGSETVRIPAPVPVDLKQRRFRRVLNLRRANAAFTSTLSTSNGNSPSPSPTTLSPVNEGFGNTTSRSRRGSIYAALAPSMIQIDVSGAGEGRRVSERGNGWRR